MHTVIALNMLFGWVVLRVECPLDNTRNVEPTINRGLFMHFGTIMMLHFYGFICTSFSEWPRPYLLGNAQSEHSRVALALRSLILKTGVLKELNKIAVWFSWYGQRNIPIMSTLILLLLLLLLLVYCYTKKNVEALGKHLPRRYAQYYLSLIFVLGTFFVYE